MKIKCYDGSEIDTDKMNDTTSFAHEQVKALHDTLCKLKMPHLIRFYDHQGSSGGASAFEHPTDDVQMAGKKLFYHVMQYLELCYPGYKLVWVDKDTPVIPPEEPPIP